jgi:hypothetical protein
MQTKETGTPVNLTATGVISECAGGLLGFFVNSTSSGTVVLSTGGTGTTGGTAITGTITPSAGTFYRFPAQINSRLYATIANTLDVTFFFAAG